MTDYREQLKQIRTFPSLVRFLRDELDWPVETEDFEELTFDYEPEELGIDAANAAKINEIKRLRPLVANQPWGIFFVKFEPKQLPVVALRRILAGVVVKKRATASAAEQPKWAEDDLLFISNYGESDERRISFAHFSKDPAKNDLPTLKVIAWDELDTPLHLEHTANLLVERLSWPSSETEWDDETWRERWRSAFELKHKEVITTSKALAERLAALARRIRGEILRVLEIETEDGKVTQLMKAFQESLVHDLNADAFADMYAQTIAYGLLSARIADPEADTADDLTLHMRTNPFLRELMETFLHVGGRRGASGGAGIDFDELGVGEVVQLLDDARMEAVVLDFGDKNPLEDPVIHFYELFLKEYDAKKRMQRGVFYTPRPVVSYIVRSVDELLRTEFGLEDGLADTTTWGEMAERHEGPEIPDSISPGQDFVQILDPATGTGTFLVEVIDVVYETLAAKWRALGQSDGEIAERWNEYVPRHLLTRLHGYELLMAPYAIAHLKVGLKLYETGYRFASDERARVYLTNALEPAHDLSGRFAFAIPALAHEAQAVNEIKRKQRFTLIIGNPPYSSSSQNREQWIMDLIETYKTTVRLEETQIQALSDDYVKFIRLSQLCIERSQLGVVAVITNGNFQQATTFRDMRGALIRFFDSLSLVDLHGNGRLREVGVHGERDENVFDILPGVCISVMSRNPGASPTRRRSDVLGTREHKYEWLASHAIESSESVPFAAEPPQFSFMVIGAALAREYESGIYLPELFGSGSYQRDKTKWYGSGFKTQQDEFAIGFAEDDIRTNVALLLADGTTEESLRSRFVMCSTDQWSFDSARHELRLLDWEELVTECLYRPFDFRYTVLHRAVVSNPRARVMAQFLRPNTGLCVGRQGSAVPGEWNLVFCTRRPEDQNLFYRGGNTNFPLYWQELESTLGSHASARHNLSSASLKRLFSSADMPATGTDALPEGVAPSDVFNYVYALLHSRSYRMRYAEFLQVDFPRIPTQGSSELFRKLASIGGELVALHLMGAPVLNRPMTVYDGPNNPLIGRIGWSDDTVWLDAAAKKKGKPAKSGSGIRGVPEAVWNFHIGGYQVCHKWLKDRKGRTLSVDDIEHYQKIVVALAQTIRLMQEIDAVVDEHGGWSEAFVGAGNEAAA